jgi:RNA polymerase sigma-70 factor (ECF subfamily)
VVAYHEDMRRVCVVVTGDALVADEAVQAAWAIAWRKLGSLRDPSRLRPWLLSVAVNEARQLHRRRRRRELIEVRVGSDLGSTARDPARGIDLIDLRNALARLSPDERAIIALRYVAGLDSNELARATGISPSGTRARLYACWTDWNGSSLMDERAPFETRLAQALDEVAGPVRPVDAVRIAHTAAAARWAGRWIDRDPARASWMLVAAAIAIVTVAVAGLALVTPRAPSVVGPGSITSPSAGPFDGAARFAYWPGLVGEEQAAADLLVVDATGSDIRRVVPGGTEAPLPIDGVTVPTWSPDGTRILFSGNGTSARVVDVTTGGVIDLPAHDACDDAIWTPDGLFIVFFAVPCGTHEGPDLVMVRADGSGEPVRLSHERSTPIPYADAPDSEDRPLEAWSPDGTRLVFGCSVPMDGPALCMLEVDPHRLGAPGYAPRLVSPTSHIRLQDATWEDPRWSPDGRTIAATLARSGFWRDSDPATRIAQVDADGTAAVILAPHAPDGGASHDPRWSPDGASVLYTSTLDAELPQGRLWVIGAGGASPRRLAIPPGLLYATACGFSPDGGLVLARSDDQVALVPVDGSEPVVHVLQEGAAVGPCPQWQPARAPLWDGFPVVGGR